MTLKKSNYEGCNKAQRQQHNIPLIEEVLPSHRHYQERLIQEDQSIKTKQNYVNQLNPTVTLSPPREIGPRGSIQMTTRKERRAIHKTVKMLQQVIGKKR